MAHQEPALDEAIVAAFRVAISIGQDDVAELLLRALECLCGGPETGGADAAYRIILRAEPGEPSRGITAPGVARGKRPTH
ncbi:hypothetical protein [Aminobacter sp. Piv2-1]|uniref:hypothetical protein n=1 Tax=Aminobacter sp. Piv2-1 TaxID=3031122 RepID=UPI0030A10208